MLSVILSDYKHFSHKMKLQVSRREKIIYILKAFIPMRVYFISIKVEVVYT